MHPLLRLFERRVAETPAKLAACDQNLMFDFRSLRAVAIGLSKSIQVNSERTHIGIMAPTSAAGAAAILACWYAGRVPVPLNFLLGPEELAKVVCDADLDCILTVSMFASLVAGSSASIVWLSAQTLVPAEGDAPPARENDLAAVIYTSGTSGDPKGVCLSFANVVSNATGAIEHFGMHAEHVFLGVIPQFHSFGFTMSTVTPLVLGATAWFVPRFSPLAIVNAIAEQRVTVVPAIASMYGALARLKDVPTQSFASLELAISGGEPLPRPTVEAFESRFGVQILEGYGLTEASPVVAANTPAANKPGSVGRALPGVSVSILIEEGRSSDATGEGELLVRGPNVMRGYRNQPEETARVVRGGALYTGDVARIDEDGFIFITGRAKEMMIIGGENVFPSEIEAVLLRHAAVADVAVVGAQDAVRGEVPIAYVVLQANHSITDQELRTHCRAHLARYKVPRDIRVSADLPRGPTGKIDRKRLAR